MKHSGPFGVILMAALCVVCATPTRPTPSSTTRYTSFEGYNSFSLSTPQKYIKNISSVQYLFNITSHFSDSFLNFNTTNSTSHLRTPEQYIVDEFNDFNEINNHTVLSRKLKHRPSRNQSLYSNFVKASLDKSSFNKTLNVSAVNKVLTKINKNKNSVVVKHIGLSNSRVTTNKNASLPLNGKNPVKIATTKVPFRLKLNLGRLTTKSTGSKYISTTSTPFLIKLSKLTTIKPKSTTLRYISINTNKPVTLNRPLNRLSNKTSTTGKRRRKPAVHKIVTKWSDNADLSQLKQNWYEDGVPYPNPNPEISSFSPPISLSDLSSVSPLVSDIQQINNYPTPNPEISSYSPQYSLNELSSLDPLNNDFIDNADVLSPSPEISSYSPPFSISDVPPIVPEESDVSDLASSNPSEEVSNPISVFNLDMVPDRTKQADSTGGSPCPSVHISSSVLSARQMECSDLNLVINSHIHQNQNGGGTRNPDISTYDAAQQAPLAPVEDVPLEEEGAALGDPLVADPGLANAGPLADTVGGTPQAAAPQAASPAAAPGNGGSGGSGGSGGDGSDGGGLKFPDLKPMFDALGYLWNGLGHLLSFLKNPYLYIVPIVLFFALGFFTVLALFPWWIPLLMLYVGAKSHTKPKNTVEFYNHVHKPIHHSDGWFWNHQTKTWQNVEDFIHKRAHSSDKRQDNIETLLTSLKNKFENNNTNIHTWKRRKRPK